MSQTSPLLRLSEEQSQGTSTSKAYEAQKLMDEMLGLVKADDRDEKGYIKDPKKGGLQGTHATEGEVDLAFSVFGLILGS
mmetsp:Transcript_14621/g.24014  ORF Transcript_14621/g.24014 Transcript_14621/m.24014 type:complete len:80 (-) Transcript_14621:164-403(-)